MSFFHWAQHCKPCLTSSSIPASARKTRHRVLMCGVNRRHASSPLAQTRQLWRGRAQGRATLAPPNQDKPPRNVPLVRRRGHPAPPGPGRPGACRLLSHNIYTTEDAGNLHLVVSGVGHGCSGHGRCCRACVHVHRNVEPYHWLPVVTGVHENVGPSVCGEKFTASSTHRPRSATVCPRQKGKQCSCKHVHMCPQAQACHCI